MKTKKNIVFIVILFILTVLFSIIKTYMSDISRNEENIYEEKTDIRMLNNWGNHNIRNEIINNYFSEYMKSHHNLNIVNESMSGDEFYVKLYTDFASGYAPDILALSPNRAVKDLFIKGKIADLTDIFKADEMWNNTIDSSMVQYTSCNGRIFGVPTDMKFYCLYVNEKIFSQYGIKIPENYEELKNSVVQLKNNEIIPMSFSIKDSQILLYQMFVALIGGNSELENPVKEGRISDCYIKAFDYVRELEELGAFPENYKEIDYKTELELFLGGNAAMMVGDSDVASIIAGGRDNYTEGLTVTAFPEIKGKTEFITTPFGAGDGTYYISSEAFENKNEDIVDLIKNITSPELSVKFVNNSKNMINVKISQPPIAEVGISFKRALLLQKINEPTAIPSQVVSHISWRKVIYDNFDKVIANEKSADEIWREALMFDNQNFLKGNDR